MADGEMMEWTVDSLPSLAEIRAELVRRNPPRLPLPQPGPQTDFLASTADIVIYGGAAGGGKSFGLLLDCARFVGVAGYTCVIFRRNSKQIMSAGGLWEKASTLYPAVGGRSRLTDHTWRFVCVPPPHQNGKGGLVDDGGAVGDGVVAHGMNSVASMEDCPSGTEEASMTPGGPGGSSHGSDLSERSGGVEGVVVGVGPLPRPLSEAEMGASGQGRLLGNEGGRETACLSRAIGMAPGGRSGGSSVIQFAHLEHEDSKSSWDGAELAYIGFDELQHLSEV